jgi:hypothetical protein
MLHLDAVTLGRAVGSVGSHEGGLEPALVFVDTIQNYREQEPALVIVGRVVSGVGGVEVGGLAAVLDEGELSGDCTGLCRHRRR